MAGTDVPAAAWLAADPRRQHEIIGITGIPQMRFSDITIGDLIQAHADGGAYASAGIGAPVTVNLPCGPDGQTMPCVTNGIYLVREDADRLAIMFKPAGLGMRDTEVNLQVIGTSQDRAEEVLREIRALAVEHSVFRGQVISFGPELFGPAMGKALGRITEACSVARTLQPAIIVVEDVDLIAEERTARPGEHPLLFQLLNEMEGLNSAADVTFLLTTNRADLLEPALAARPGRVDLAAELPLPDAAARHALLRLYQGNLDLAGVELEPVIDRTEGATAPFLRELLRKAALLAAEEEDGAPDAGVPLRVTQAQLTVALDQLLSSRGQLTRVLLGGQR